jgi:hypothetical protein
LVTRFQRMHAEYCKTEERMSVASKFSFKWLWKSSSDIGLSRRERRLIHTRQTSPKICKCSN